MSYDEEEQRQSRVVVDTPNTHREVVQTQTTRVPEERRGFSTAAIATVALAAIALTAILFMFLTRGEETGTNTNINLATQPTPAPQTTIIQQPAPQQPTTTIIQPPMTTTQAPPVIVTQPPSTTTTVPSTTTTSNTANTSTSGTDDISLQDGINRKFTDDTQLSSANLTVTVLNGRATLTGSVSTQQLKDRAKRLAQVRGVRNVDNQIIVTGDMSSTAPPPPPGD